jgi:serine/threonine protein kinase
MWSAAVSWFTGNHIQIPQGQILNNRYRIISEPYKSTFGTVYLCQDIQCGADVAIKIFRPKLIVGDLAEQEQEILQKLNQIDPSHTFVIGFFGAFSLYGHSCLILERGGVSLWEFHCLREESPFPVQFARSIAFHIACGLRLCHDHGVIHTDIKLENILLPLGFDLQNGINQDDIPVKLIDFGSAGRSRQWNWGLTTTRFYRAPEIILGLPWGYECDIWSLGSLLAELVLGSIEFTSDNPPDHIRAIQRMIAPIPKWMQDDCTQAAVLEVFGEECAPAEGQVRVEEQLAFDGQLQDLIRRMLDPDPRTRISLNLVIRHPFFDPVRAQCEA